MSKALMEKQADGTIKLSITLPKELVDKTKTQVVEEFVKSAKVAGFRQGKAPSSLVEGQLDQDKVREEVLKKLLPGAYTEAVTANNIKPIMNPKIHIDKLDPKEDWVFSALTCEEPEVDLGDYKKNVKDVTAKSKIVVPGKEQQKPTSQDVMLAVAKSVKATIPSVLIEQETDKLLSQLLNDIKKLGLSLDQYMASTNRTADNLREEYAKRAEEDLKLEFALHKIAETEKISVEAQEVDEAIQKAGSDEERQSLENNRYMLAAILRQQKTIDFLLNL